MKLETEEPIASDGGGEGAAVLHRREDRAFVDGLDGIRMDEVEVRLVGNAGEPGMLSNDPHLVPTGVRDPHVAAEASHATAAQAESRRPGIFLTLVEEELHSHTQAQERDAPIARHSHHDVETEAAELARAMTKPADAGQHDGLRRQDVDVRSRDPHVVSAGAPQRRLEAW